MNALDVLYNIFEHSNLILASFKYCLVGHNKHPYRIDGKDARPNKIEDFVSLNDLCECKNLEKYAGIGISIQASNVCAIDVDSCFSIPFDISSADNRAKDIIERFKHFAYIEFSFSGKGLRVFFKQPNIENYASKYYIKNDRVNIEYYQPLQSFRYVTITGMTIVDNNIQSSNDFTTTILTFLNDYMKRTVIEREYVDVHETDSRSLEQLLIEVKKLYFKDIIFQNLWFSQAPGSGKDESQKDYHLVAYLYEKITQDKEKLRQVFECSPFYKSKDTKHVNKWQYNNYRYFNYLYDRIRR